MKPSRNKILYSDRLIKKFLDRETDRIWYMKVPLSKEFVGIPDMHYIRDQYRKTFVSSGLSPSEVHAVMIPWIQNLMELKSLVFAEHLFYALIGKRFTPLGMYLIEKHLEIRRRETILVDAKDNIKVELM